MPAKRKDSAKDTSSSANIGFEAKLWLAADKLRNNMDAAEYKHVVLGLIFLKYIYGQENNATTRRLAVMNLAIRGIEADFGPEHADTFRRDLHPDLHPDLRADFVLANPPFNDSDWFRKDDDVRWQPSGARSTAIGSPQGERGGVHQFGVPPKGNANCACLGLGPRALSWAIACRPVGALMDTCPTHRPALEEYIANQAEHHRLVTFQDEYRRLLNKNGIQFDEHYVWD